MSVWLVPLDGRSDLDRFAAPLSREETERARSFHFERDRKSYIAAHGALRYALSERAHTVPADSWQFDREQGGRPLVSSPREWAHLRFSLSHSARMSACLISEGVDGGIDVEDAGRVVGLELVERFYTAAEQREAAGLSDHALDRFLIRNWTLKEAYLKALGIGLSVDGLRQVGFTGEDDVIAPAIDGEPLASSAWLLQSWVDSGCRVSIALRAADRNVSIVRHTL